MSEIISKTLENKLAIFYFCLFTVNALATVIIASFLNIEWSSLTPTKKFILIWVIIQNWTGTMIAFFNQTISRINKGGPILPAVDDKPTT